MGTAHGRRPLSDVESSARAFQLTLWRESKRIDVKELLQNSLSNIDTKSEAQAHRTSSRGCELTVREAGARLQSNIELSCETTETLWPTARLLAGETE